MHSLAVTDKRGTFRNWTVLLAVAAFALSLLGTFLVRSGVLVSVHSFAADPSRGQAILIYLVTVIGISLALYAWRAPKVGFGGDFKLASRETMLLSGNVMMSVAAAAVLLGTIYPLIHDALGMGKLSVGPPYFDSIFLPLIVPVIFLMGVGPMARWKQTSVPELAARLKWALLAGVIGAIVFPLMMGGFSIMIGLGVLMAFWVFGSAVVNVVTRVQTMSGNAGVLSKLAKQPLHYYGMLTAHIGIGVFILGVTLVNGYEQEKDVRMDIGDYVTMEEYTFRFDGTLSVPGPNYRAERGTIVVTRDDKLVTILHPEKRIYKVQQNPMTEAGIESGFWRQLYVALGEPIGNGAWSVRVYFKPFVTWIWVGCFIMGMGGILAISDRRYRISSRVMKKVEADSASTKTGASTLAAEGEQ
jgi:cytochrome c-type biogenesis protein CcmF